MEVNSRKILGICIDTNLPFETDVQTFMSTSTDDKHHSVRWKLLGFLYSFYTLYAPQQYADMSQVGVTPFCPF